MVNSPWRWQFAPCLHFPNNILARYYSHNETQPNVDLSVLPYSTPDGYRGHARSDSYRNSMFKLTPEVRSVSFLDVVWCLSHIHLP
jgi:hypothetical protein